ncbi:toxin glutamine deamidase domain-containing protein [Kitasatospora fiedleri]|uniref:toxin glutamine deamidase domain-containing protein n=1 Tax=Kitasatospora fiedleri TaxID=2991545 RepID=UPI00249C5DE5|nr:toxin glutamine deamidase domain-containing protein [Kitasatospora fiedleri]
MLEGRGFRAVGPDHPLAHELVDYLGGEPKLHPPMSNKLLQKVNPHETPVHHDPDAPRPGRDLNACLENVEAYRDTHFGRPRVSGQTLHGEVEHAGGDALWKRHDAPARFGEGPGAVKELMERVEAGGPGSFATVIGAGPHGDGHAVALVHDRDGTLRWADLTDRRVSTADGRLPGGFGEGWTLWASVAGPHEQNLSGPHDPAFMDRFGTLNAHGADPSDGIGVSHTAPAGAATAGTFSPLPKLPKPPLTLKFRGQYDQEVRSRKNADQDLDRAAADLRDLMTRDHVDHRRGRRIGDVIELGPADHPDVTFDVRTREFSSKLDPTTLSDRYPGVAGPARRLLENGLRRSGGTVTNGHLLGDSEFLAAYGAQDPATQGYWHEQDARLEELDALAADLAVRRHSGRPAPDAVGQLLTPQADAVRHAQDLLGQHQGFVLGEKHGDPATWTFLRDNMAALHANEVRTVYLEQFRDDAFQRELDDYLAGDGTRSALFEQIVRRQSGRNADAVLDVLEQARVNGVDVRLIDGYPARKPKDPVPPGLPVDPNLYQRARRMNAYAHEVINTHRAEPGTAGRYLVVVGAHHVGTHPAPPGRPPAPGIADTLGIPGVRFRPGPNGLAAPDPFLALEPVQ